VHDGDPAGRDEGGVTEKPGDDVEGEPVALRGRNERLNDANETQLSLGIPKKAKWMTKAPTAC